MNGAGAGHPQLLDLGLEQLFSVHLKEQQKVLALEGERSAGGGGGSGWTEAGGGRLSWQPGLAEWKLQFG